VGGPLACPRCAREYSLDERFCQSCGMPLVYVGSGEGETASEAQRRARKIKPQYLGGELVRVTGTRNQAEAELVQGILLEEGIPSVQKRTRGFDVPDFLAAGPRDILVPQAAVDDAHELLAGAELEVSRDPARQPQGERPLRLLAGILIAVAAAALIVWLLYQATA
jgi:pimeloyl-ACP methyl ester carboxylesterase